MFNFFNYIYFYYYLYYNLKVKDETFGIGELARQENQAKRITYTIKYDDKKVL